jgi:hypothetical protein
VAECSVAWRFGNKPQGMEEEEDVVVDEEVEVAWQITASSRYYLLARKRPRFLSKALVFLVLFLNGKKVSIFFFEKMRVKKQAQIQIGIE